MKPFLPNTDAIVTVRIQSAFLSCGRPLPPNPVCRIRSTSDGGAVLASTQAIAFTQSPCWNEDLQFVVSSIHAKSTFQLEIVDAFSGSFLGAVNALPFHVRWPQRTTKLHRLMLTPRNNTNINAASSSSSTTTNVADIQLLKDASEDDFGHIELAWDVQLCPIGPGPEEFGSQQQCSLPLSCMLRAQWIGMVSAAPSHTTSLMAHLGSSTQAVSLSSENPLVALLRSESEASIRITCKHRTPTRDEDVGLCHFVVPVRMGPTDRELTWCLPITPISTEAENSLGMVVLSLRLAPANVSVSSSTSETNTAAAQSENTNDNVATATSTNSFAPDRSPPNCGFGPYQQHHWEDQDHLARASERRWKKSVVNDAKPKPNHVRHLLDVMAGRTELHPAVAPHMKEFFNVAPDADIKNLCSPTELRTFAIALAFASEQLTVEESVMFSMGLLCSPIAGGERRLPSMNDAVIIFENCLLPFTLDLSTKELRRRCLELFANVSVAPEHGIDIILFRKRFASNFGFWFVHGASQIAHRTPPQPLNSISSFVTNQQQQQQQLSSSSAAGNFNINNDSSAEPINAPNSSTSAIPSPNSRSNINANSSVTVNGGGGGSNDDLEWLRFIVRVARTKMGFAVTAHRDDTFVHVSSMIESTVDIPCAKQRFTFRGERVDVQTAVGSLVPPGILPQTEFLLSEISDLMQLVIVWRTREKKYDIKIAPQEKVLKLRAMIQQKTNIPLSRIQINYCNQPLWDRHSLEHYKLCDGAIIEVNAE